LRLGWSPAPVRRLDPTAPPAPPAPPGAVPAPPVAVAPADAHLHDLSGLQDGISAPGRGPRPRSGSSSHSSS